MSLNFFYEIVTLNLNETKTEGIFKGGYTIVICEQLRLVACFYGFAVFNRNIKTHLRSKE